MGLVAQFQSNHITLEPLFPVLVIVVALIIVLVSHYSWRANFRQTLQRVARQLHGRIRQGNLFTTFDRIQFEHAGQEAEVRFSDPGKKPYFTHVEIRWAGPRFRCEIFPETFLSGLSRLMGMQDIVIGSPQFDRAFVITGDDEPAIRALLNGQAQAAIFQLAEYVRGMHIRIGARSLTVTCKQLLSDFVRLVEFVRLCRELCDAVVVAQAHGIQFLEEPSPANANMSAAEGHCMVCGEPLVSDVVYCRSCKTPHHRECWSYCGGCSTYGCGQKSFAMKS